MYSIPVIYTIVSKEYCNRMQRTRRKSNVDGRDAKPEFDQVLVTDIRKGRRGKHHDLLSRVMKDLLELPQGAAIKIPLTDVDGVSLANLRSAVHRRTTARGIAIETLSDNQN